MKKLAILLMLLFAPVMIFFAQGNVFAADACGKDRTFFGLPTWYKYLDFNEKDCSIIIADKIAHTEDGKTTVQDVTLINIWLIVLAIIEMLLRLAGLVAFIFIIIGGFKFVTAEGNPDKIVNARMTVFNALIGAVVAILASQIVGYVAGRLQKNVNQFGLSETSADTSTYTTILNSALAILGAIAVLMIIIQGIRFILARGDTEKIGRARNGIIYAFVGLIVAIFASVIINLVINAL